MLAQTLVTTISDENITENATDDLDDQSLVRSAVVSDDLAPAALLGHKICFPSIYTLPQPAGLIIVCLPAMTARQADMCNRRARQVKNAQNWLSHICWSCVPTIITATARCSFLIFLNYRSGRERLVTGRIQVKLDYTMNHKWTHSWAYQGCPQVGWTCGLSHNFCGFSWSGHDFVDMW